jgi:hypothetical protein
MSQRVRRYAFGPARWARSKTIPETGQPPIRVYREHDSWHVDYGEGVTNYYDSREEAESAADAVAQDEEREVVVEE